MQLDTVPNFNLVKSSSQGYQSTSDYYKINNLINLNYVRKIQKGEHGSSHTQASIRFEFNQDDYEYWIYERTKEGTEMRDEDFEKLCNLSKI